MKLFLYAFAGLAILSSALAKPKTHIVNVGPNSTLAYNPPYISAHKGDVVKFIFHPKNHTASQSSFEYPCKKLRHGFDSGFEPIKPSYPEPKTVLYHVKTKDPLWFFCRQTVPVSHCGKGMVFAINPPKHGHHTFAAFKARAISQYGGKRDMIDSEDAE
ncbi:Cupredoxin [Cantharellus anzutake]|uniref:Cupredoxin n=1 Tax=Cantharellus anzutake TaxID=1750568 RepID=UPI001905038E|nr:Cupredoxin [Cantharellus anzutake]KAF8337004.1 Cupredoxin [Cantharellus anzutake]